MAICVPEQIDRFDFATPGEVSVLQKLKKLPDEYHVYYEVIVGERDHRPDFAVIHPNYGVLIIEVKDWAQSTIRTATERTFEVRMNRQWHTVVNPERKCQKYITEVRNIFHQYDALINQYDQIVVPVNYLVAFPNMPYDEFQQMSLGDVLNIDFVALKSDVRDGDRFVRLIHKIMSPLSQPLTLEQIQLVRLTLDPSIRRKDTGLRQLALWGGQAPPEGGVPEFALDVDQARLAKQVGEGPRLLRGMAGSGKTLIILMRAKMEAHMHEQLNQRRKNSFPFRILIICYNITLANYMRQAFTDIEVSLENAYQVEIIHIGKWAYDFIENHRGRGSFNNAQSANFDDKISELLPKINVSEEDLYDAIYIDEGQDFRAEWIEFLFNQMVRGDDPRQKRFIIALDDAQRIYRHQGDSQFSWAKLNIPMQGRAKVLRRVYRNSPRIWMFAGFLLGNISRFYQEDGVDPSKIWFAPKRGIDPEIVQCLSIRHQIDEAVHTIKQLVSDGYDLRHIMVLYHSKTYQHSKLYKDFPLIEELKDALSQANIDFHWISENSKTKKSFTWDNKAVKVSTVYSAKGLDAPAVIILGAESFDGFTPNDNADDTALMYVAMTRAREYLKILYSEETSIAKELLRTQQDYFKYRARIIEIERQS